MYILNCGLIVCMYWTIPFLFLVFVYYIVCSLRLSFLCLFGMCRQLEYVYHLIYIVSIIPRVVLAMGRIGICMCLSIFEVGGLFLCLVC